MSNIEKKQEAIDFLAWCNERMHRPANELSSKPRAIPQWPDYSTYLVIDDKGRSVLPEGEYLTIDELYEFWKSSK